MMMMMMMSCLYATGLYTVGGR